MLTKIGLERWIQRNIRFVVQDQIELDLVSFRTFHEIGIEQPGVRGHGPGGRAVFMLEPDRLLAE